MNVVQSPNNNFFGHYYFAFGYKTISINSRLLFMHVSLDSYHSELVYLKKYFVLKCIKTDIFWKNDYTFLLDFFTDWIANDGNYE